MHAAAAAASARETRACRGRRRPAQPSTSPQLWLRKERKARPQWHEDSGSAVAALCECVGPAVRWDLTVTCIDAPAVRAAVASMERAKRRLAWEAPRHLKHVEWRGVVTVQPSTRKVKVLPYQFGVKTRHLCGRSDPVRNVARGPCLARASFVVLLRDFP